MSRIINDDRDGNYLVEVFAIKQRVNSFQTRTLEDAIEEAWRVYQRRQQNTATQTRKVTVCRMWRAAHGWRRTDHQDITQQLRERWNKEDGNPTNAS